MARGPMLHMCVGGPLDGKWSPAWGASLVVPVYPVRSIYEPVGPAHVDATEEMLPPFIYRLRRYGYFEDSQWFWIPETMPGDEAFAIVRGRYPEGSFPHPPVERATPLANRT